MPKERKAQSTAWHAKLSVPEQDECFKLCNELGYAKAASAIKDQFALAATPSKSAVARWYGDWPLRRAFLTSGSVAETFKAMLRDLPGLADKADEIEHIGQQLFTACTLQQMDREGFVQMRKLSQKDEMLHAEKQKLEMELQKYRDAQAAIQREVTAAKAAGGIRPETWDKIEKELNLL